MLAPEDTAIQPLDLELTWEGPFSLDVVRRSLADGGEPPDFDGNDYGVYQVYGEHILSGPNTLLYVGKAVGQTFASRFAQHGWLDGEFQPLSIHVARLYHPDLHSERDHWASWEQHLGLVECVLIHKYSPNYNHISISSPPNLSPYSAVRIWHRGSRGRLDSCDRAPDDYQQSSRTV